MRDLRFELRTTGDAFVRNNKDSTVHMLVGETGPMGWAGRSGSGLTLSKGLRRGYCS
jgi:hypothetical protein